MTRIPVVEIGGTHVAAGLVDLERRAVLDRTREPIDDADDLDLLAGHLADAVAALPVERGARWAVAVPGPFDYAHGIGDFAGTEKLSALAGVDVGALLRAAAVGVEDVSFVNDASAFGVGEAWFGAGRGAERVTVLTLGTGIGSAFVEHGRLIESGNRVPANGWIYPVQVDGRGLEEHFSRRALIAAYAADGGESLDVAEIAERARGGEDRARRVLASAFDALARGLRPVLEAFDPGVLVIGGSIARSWDIVEALLVPRLRHHHPALRVRGAALGDDAPMLGAARWLTTLG